jgi:glutathione S-transferase
MKLFTMPGTCALSVHIVLEWIGQPYDIEVMARGSNTSVGYLAINPSGQVPALQLDNGQVLTEAAAILTYLSDVTPEANLGNGSPDPFARYELAQLLSYLTGEVHVAFKPYFSPQRFLNDETQFKSLQAQAFAVLTPMLDRLDNLAALFVQPHPEPPVLDVNVFDLHPERRADPGKAEHHQPDQRSVA